MRIFLVEKRPPTPVDPLTEGMLPEDAELDHAMRQALREIEARPSLREEILTAIRSVNRVRPTGIPENSGQDRE